MSLWFFLVWKNCFGFHVRPFGCNFLKFKMLRTPEHLEKECFLWRFCFKLMGVHVYVAYMSFIFIYVYLFEYICVYIYIILKFYIHYICVCVYECGLYVHFDKPVVYFPKSFQCCNGVPPKAISLVIIMFVPSYGEGDPCEVCCFFFFVVLPSFDCEWMTRGQIFLFVDLLWFMEFYGHFIVLLYEKTRYPEFSLAVCFREPFGAAWVARKLRNGSDIRVSR